MSFNPLKEFFKRKKAEAKFSRAGPGQKLSSDPQPEGSSGASRDQTPARQAAAEAAMKRFNKDNTRPTQRPRMTPSSSNSTSSSRRLNETAAKSNIVEAKPGPPVELPIVNGVAERSVQVYSTEELAQRIKQPDIDDDFFRLTVDDAKLFQQRYEEERARNEILRTSEMRRREAEAKKPTTNIARLRFKLPNNFVLEASFSGNETLGTVRDWLVISCLDKMELELQKFDILFCLRPFKEADMAKSIRDLGLLPATTLSVVQK